MVGADQHLKLRDHRLTFARRTGVPELMPGQQKVGATAQSVRMGGPESHGHGAGSKRLHLRRRVQVALVRQQDAVHHRRGERVRMLRTQGWLKPFDGDLDDVARLTVL